MKANTVVIVAITAMEHNTVTKTVVSSTLTGTFAKKEVIIYIYRKIMRS